jgi:GNAT superfamily N-acetyltransferase
MPDMLVKLYELDDDWQFIAGQKNRGIAIRKPIGPEKHAFVQWVMDNFGPAWAGESEVAFGNSPRSCFVAIKQAAFVGFACYDATALGFFGPVGVDRRHRRSGIGAALLKTCLLEMKFKGYGYAVIGAVEDTDFYVDTVDAQEIPGSTPGFYRGWVGKTR